ncbi:DUF2279 domain-containing protein [Sphingomonas sp. PB4P5]|uniref:DUF2279 domain-containing protein n=1 Tax=Parasphingomonas puruogangriensis TaxID=3096155 RepID=UPI002FCB4BD8
MPTAYKIALPEAPAAREGTPAAEALVGAPLIDVRGGGADATPHRYDSFGAKVGAVKWEFGGMLALFSVIHVGTAIRDPQKFRFQNEGFFGRDTNNLGLDKLAHGFNTYVYSDVLYNRIARKAGTGVESALTAAALATGLQLLGEVTDGLHQGSGFSVHDLALNVAGGGFSVLRNSVPGMKDKLDFRLSIVPNDELYTFKGKKHYQQQRYLFAVKLAGFDRLARTPLRLFELHLGYYGKNFLNEDRARGVVPQRKIFAGFGINFGELVFRNSQSKVGRAIRSATHYFQLPYTTLRLK